MFLVILLGMALSVQADEQGMKNKEEKTAVKGEEVTITGTISCSFCKMSQPDKTCPKGCCTKCVQGGDPALLTDAEGNMYLLVTNEKGKPVMNAERMEMIGEKVVVKGVLVKGKGLQSVFVESIEKAKIEKDK